MKLALRFALLAALACGLMLVMGCSEDDAVVDPGNDLFVGDTNDVAFQQIDGLFDENDVHDSYQISADLSFELIESQFPDAMGAGGRQANGSIAGMGDSSVIAISQYSYAGGWHVFSFQLAVYEWHMEQPFLVATAAGIDSVQVLSGGQPQAVPDSTADAYSIRAHFEWDFAGGVNSFAAYHSIDLVADFEKAQPDLTVNGSLNQMHSGSWEINPGTDSAVSCDLSMNTSQTITNMVFLYDVHGDPGGCPVSGSISVTASVNLACSGLAAGEELAVDGTWTMTGTVQNGGDIDVTYSDGTTSWSATEPCVEEAIITAPNFPRH